MSASVSTVFLIGFVIGHAGLGEGAGRLAVLGVAVAGPQVYLLYNAPTDALVLL